MEAAVNAAVEPGQKILIPGGGMFADRFKEMAANCGSHVVPLEVLNAGKTLGIPVGLHCSSSEVALRRIAEGFSFVTISANDVFVIEGAKSVLERVY